MPRSKNPNRKLTKTEQAALAARDARAAARAKKAKALAAAAATSGRSRKAVKATEPSDWEQAVRAAGSISVGYDAAKGSPLPSGTYDIDVACGAVIPITSVTISHNGKTYTFSGPTALDDALCFEEMAAAAQTPSVVQAVTYETSGDPESLAARIKNVIGEVDALARESDESATDWGWTAKYTSPGEPCLNPGRRVGDAVKHPSHYNAHPSGVEAIDILQAFNFNLGSALKYIWRAGLKDGTKIQDLRKAREYIDFEIARIEKFEMSSSETV